MVRSLISFGMLPWSRSSMLSQPTKHGTLSHLPTPMSSLANGCTKTRTTSLAPWLGTRHTVFCVVSHSNLALITLRLSTSSSNQRQSKQLFTYAPTRCNVKNTFLNGVLQEMVYCQPPLASLTLPIPIMSTTSTSPLTVSNGLPVPRSVSS